ncbi:hypothetical protein RCK58_24085, partial [Salmonella enterica subsp. enterica serovar 1,4,[5],12:i:-]
MNTFDNQALNTLYNWSNRAWLCVPWKVDISRSTINSRQTATSVHPASAVQTQSDIYVTDPPYADAINYHEIT